MLTTGADAFSTTSTTNTMTANSETITGSLNSLSSGDSIVDATTTDADSLTVDLTANVDSTVTLTNVENLSFNVLSGTRVVDNTLMTGVKTIEHSGAGALTVTNVQSAATTYKMTSTGAALNITQKASVITGAADNLSVALSGTTGGASVTVNGAVEAVTLTSSGTTANTLNALTAASATTLTINGGAGITLGKTASGGTALANTISTIDARTAGTTDIQIAGGAGTTVLTGTTNDTVTISAALNASDLISMGTGTDTLVLANSTGGATGTLTGVENIKTVDAGAVATAIDLTNANQAANIDLANVTAATSVSVTNMMAGSTVKATTALGGGGALAVGYKGSATDTVLNLDVKKGGSVTSETFTNVGDLTITTGAAYAATSTVLDKTTSDGSVATTKFTAVNNVGAASYANFTNASKVTDLTLTSAGAGSSTTIGTIVDADSLTNITLNATAGTVITGAIGGTTASAKLNAITINAGAATTLGAVGAANAAGVSTVVVHATGGDVTGNTLTNTGGNIKSVTIDGTKDVAMSFTTAAAGHVETVNASALTGALTSTITNADPVAAGTVVTLGNAVAGKINIVTVVGAMHDTVTGGTGVDSIDGGRGSNTLDGAGGANDTLSYLNGGNNVGKIINISGETKYLNSKTAGTAAADGSETVATGKSYDITSANIVNVAATAGVDTISGFENVTGSAQADIIYGSTSANVIAAGAGADTITVGAGTDTVVYGASATDLVSYAGADITAANIEKVLDFTVADDTFQLTVGSTFAGLVLAATTGFSVNESGAAPAALAAGLATVTALAAAMETAGSGVASTTGVAGSATGIQAYFFTTSAGAGAFDGKTFLVINDATATIAATDVIIDITGVTGTITAADFTIV